jgi:methylenetetrahydrofolate reductase (NADPH)
MKNGFDISFEFFPPKTSAGMAALIDNAQQLITLQPKYCSVTFGAGGSIQDNTAKTITALKNNFDIRAVPHLSCINSDKKRIDTLLQGYKKNAISDLVVLRGDLPDSTAQTNGAFKHASDLVRYIRQTTGNAFSIHVAVYPETHPETLNPFEDLQYFKQKIEAGANHAITQYCFNIEAFERMLDDCAKLGINAPITAGIMPITNYTQLARFSNMCGAEIPRWLRLRLESYQDDMPSLQSFGVDVVANLCQRLLTLDIAGLHFYTLNKADASLKILSALGIKKPHTLKAKTLA